MKRGVQQKLRSAALVLGLLLSWQAVVWTGMISPLLLASPWSVLQWLAQAAGTERLWLDIGMTLARVLIAFGLSLGIGVPFGLLLGRYSSLERLFRFPVDFSRSIPATALFPVFLVCFGTGEGSRVAAAVYGSSLIILLNTIVGVKGASLTRLKAAKALGATGFHLFFLVLIPEALPSILTGLRLGVSLCFVIIVLVEMFIGTSAGLGHRIIDAQMVYQIPNMYGSVLICGCLGFAINRGFVFIEERITHYVGH